MDFNLWFLRTQFQPTITEFYRDLAAMLRNGLSFPQFLTDNIEADPKSVRGQACAIMLTHLAQVKNELETIALFAPPNDRLALLAARELPNIESLLLTMADSAEAVNAEKAKLVKALTMPVITLAAAMGVVAFFGSQIIPITAEIYAVAKWQAFARWYYYLSTFMASWGGIAVSVGLAVCMAVVIWSFGRWVGPLRRFADEHIFPWSLVRNFRAVQFLVLYALLLRSVPSADERKIAKQMSDSGDPWLKSHLAAIEVNLTQNPEKLGAAFNTGLLPREVLMRLTIYLQNAKGSTSDAIDAVAKDSLKSISKGVDKLIPKISLAVLIIVSCVIVWSISSMNGPLQKFSKEIKEQRR